MAKANRVRTRYPGISKVGERYEWVAGRDRGRGTTDTLVEARSAKAKAELAGPVSAAVRGKFGDYARTWIAGYQGRTNRGFSESTRADYRESLDLYLIPFFEARKLKPHQITRQHVKALIAWLATEPTAAEYREKIGLRRPLATRTIVKHLAPLKAMFADAVEDDELPRNPATVRINLAGDPASTTVEKRPFTDEQLAVVLAASADKDRLLFDTAAETGARWGELCEFRGGDLATTGDGPVLRVQRAYSDKARNSDGQRVGIVKLPKSSAGRRDIPLSPELARRLWRLQRGPDDLLFTSPRGERMHYQHTRDLVLKPTLARASKRLDGDELGWAGWHTFRHTVASRMFAAGRNVVQVQKWLGHHKPSFTLDTYVHLMGESIGEPLALPEVVEERAGGRRGADKARETGLNAEGPDSPVSSTFAG